MKSLPASAAMEPGCVADAVGWRVCGGRARRLRLAPSAHLVVDVGGKARERTAVCPSLLVVGPSYVVAATASCRLTLPRGGAVVTFVVLIMWYDL